MNSLPRSCDLVCYFGWLDQLRIGHCASVVLDSGQADKPALCIPRAELDGEPGLLNASASRGSRQKDATALGLQISEQFETKAAASLTRPPGPAVSCPFFDGRVRNSRLVQVTNRH